MHLKSVLFSPEKYPSKKIYPFNLEIFKKTSQVKFNTTVTFLIGENGSGKSTLLRAIANKAGIHIWEDTERKHFKSNPHENDLYKFINLDWHNGFVQGAYFGSDIFKHFTQILDEWAASDPGILEYFGGKSLRTQSHGQSLMAYFKSRFQIKGLYLIDEPETALSPKSQLAFLKILNTSVKKNQSQFIIATHSPLLMACPGATIYTFNQCPIGSTDYESTEYFQTYKNFLLDRSSFLS